MCGSYESYEVVAATNGQDIEIESIRRGGDVLPKLEDGVREMQRGVQKVVGHISRAGSEWLENRGRLRVER